jgi:hypothetical protein
MIISEKQHQANRQNAQQSTGPKTPEGKSAIRFNALTYGLRTRETIFPLENAEEYSDLWDELEAEWQPQTRTERLYLETMVTSQWLLKRLADSEKRIYQCIAHVEERFKTLAYVYKQRAQLERSFRTAIADMKQSRMERKAIQPQPPQAAKPASAPASQPAGPQTPPPDYVMSNGAEAHPVSASPASPDTR